MNDDWISVKVKLPTQNLRYKVLIDGVGIRYSDFNIQTRAWEISGNVISWKEAFSAVEIPISSVDLNDMVKLRNYDDPELIALTSLAENQMARMIGAVKIDVSVYTITDDANVNLAGRVLAISESYAAQQTGVDSMVIHETNRLSKHVKPGDEVTVEYKDGLGDVHFGIKNVKSVRVTCDELLREEIYMIESKVKEIIEKLTKSGIHVTKEMIDVVVKKAVKKISEVEGWANEPEKVIVKQIQSAEIQSEKLSELNQEHLTAKLK